MDGSSYKKKVAFLFWCQGLKFHVADWISQSFISISYAQFHLNSDRVRIWLDSCHSSFWCPKKVKIAWQQTFTSSFKFVTSHVATLWESFRSLVVPVLPCAKSKSINCASSTSFGVPNVFGTVISLQWNLSIWCRGCWDEKVRFSITQNGSIR